MPAVKSGALPVEMLLPIAETMGLSCPALATLNFLPWLGIQVPAQPWEAVLPEHWHGPRSHELQGDRRRVFCWAGEHSRRLS